MYNHFQRSISVVNKMLKGEGRSLTGEIIPYCEISFPALEA